MARLIRGEPITCSSCGAFEVPKESPAKPPHDIRVSCPNCGRTHGFLAKEKNQKKLDHRPNGQPNVSQLMEFKGIDFCEICLRRKDQLGKRGFFEVHHISKDPTNNETVNLLLVCKACHQFIHYLQTYMNDHMKEFTGAPNDGA